MKHLMASLPQLSLAIILILNYTQSLNLTQFQCQSSTHIPILTLTLTHLSRCHPILIHLSRHNSGCSLAKRT